MQRSTDISILVGSNRDEMRLYVVPNGSIDRTTDDDLRRFVGDTGLQTGAEAAYRLALSARGDSPPTAGEVLCSMQSDYFYRIPARRIAEHAADAGLDAYLYEFEWESSRCERRLLAAHGVEIPFVFQKLQTEPGQEITGPGAPADLATEMNEAWASFVKSGDPGWPKFERATGGSDASAPPTLFRKTFLSPRPRSGSPFSDLEGSTPCGDFVAKLGRFHVTAYLNNAMPESEAEMVGPIGTIKPLITPRPESGHDRKDATRPRRHRIIVVVQHPTLGAEVLARRGEHVDAEVVGADELRGVDGRRRNDGQRRCATAQVLVLLP